MRKKNKNEDDLLRNIVKGKKIKGGRREEKNGETIEMH